MPVNQSGIVPPLMEAMLGCPAFMINKKYAYIGKKMNITARQCKAARALLGWSQTKLAEAASVHFRTVHDFEKGVRKPITATLAVLRRALEDGGVVFIPVNGGGQGVRLREPEDEQAASPAASE